MYETRLQGTRNTSHAFSHIELLACLAACALLVAVITPALATSRSRADRVACFSNLRQIGNAFRQFALEHDGYPAWRSGAGPDGNFTQANMHELWFQYWWLRDSLGTPKILMDPAETRSGARVATEWGLVPEVGLQSLGNRAVSYPLGMGHYRGSDYEYTDVPRTIIALDRNFIGSSCDPGSPGTRCVKLTPELTGWHDDIHGVIGNVAFADGSVDSLASEQLREAVRKVLNSAGYVPVHSASFW